MKIKNLYKLIISILKKYGLSENNSKVCARALINAELSGASSHGVARLSSYCNRIKKKVINPKPKIKINKISQSISQIDADDAIGFVGADIGINQAIINAKKTGIGFVKLKIAVIMVYQDTMLKKQLRKV